MFLAEGVLSADYETETAKGHPTVKLKALALALFVAGACTSFAVADDGHGKGKQSATTTSESTTTSATGDQGKQADKKVTLCHRAGKSGRFVKISVAKSAVKSGLKHGDVLPDASGKCPAKAPTATTEGTSTDGTTTTSPTTTTNAA